MSKHSINDHHWVGSWGVLKVTCAVRVSDEPIKSSNASSKSLVNRLLLGDSPIPSNTSLDEDFSIFVKCWIYAFAPKLVHSL